MQAENFDRVTFMKNHWTRSKFEEYSKTADYMLSRLHEAKTAADVRYWIKRIVDLTKHETEFAWSEAVYYARKSLESDENLTSEQKELEVEFRAEIALVELGKLPPHWTSKLECPLCGVMPCKPGKENDPCPWDGTPIGHSIQKSKEKLIDA